LLQKAGPLAGNAARGVLLLLRRQSFGGYFQWVLDAACEAVEWPIQPLGFNSLALLSALDQNFDGFKAIC